MADVNASHLITIPIGSASLEALTSIVFELLLLGALAILAQLVCAHYNIRRLYDEREPIKIGSPILPLRVHAPIGHLPLSITLAIFLLVASLMNNLLSFAINGRSEPRFTPTSYSSVVTFHPDARPLAIDYTAEYSLRPAEGGEAKAPSVSARLRATRLADQCMNCSYTECTIYAYAFDGVALNDSLVDPDADFPSTCLTNEFFEKEQVWLTYKLFADGELLPSLQRTSATLPGVVARQADVCDIKAAKATFKPGEAFAGAELETGKCNVEVQDVRCFKREGSEVYCAGVSPVPTGGLKVLMFQLSKEGPKDTDIQWVTNGHLMEEGDFATYSANVAYMRSIELSAQLSMLQRMATATVKRDVVLLRRDEDAATKLYSDVDLRLALPGVVFNLLLLVVLLGVDAWLYYTAVVAKGRRGFNTFSSVPDVLAVLTDETHDRRRVEREDDHPGIAIQVTQPSLGVSRSKREDALERHTSAQGVNADDWDELQIS